MKAWLYAFIFMIVAGTLPGSAAAHKINLFAYVQAGRVYCEGYFPDGRPVQGGKIQVYDSGKNLLLDGVTDEQGYFDFVIPANDDLTIVLDASLGHKTTCKLKRAELEAGK